MAEATPSRSSPSSGLSIDDLHELFKTIGPKERVLMQQLLAVDTGREGMVLAQLLHYFPGSRLEQQ